MAKSKNRGYGTVVKCDIAGNATFVAVGFTTQTKPPGVRVKPVDGNTLDDDYDVQDPGQFDSQTPEFTQFVDENDASDLTGAQIDELAESKAKRDFRWEYANGATRTVNCWVEDVDEGEVVNNEYRKRTVKLRATELVTRAAGS